MALDSRYVIASSMEELFRDKDTGLPLRNGKVKFFRDKARTTTKDVFKFSGSVDAPVYTNIGAELTLNSIGTMSSSGSDDIVVYYFTKLGDPDDNSATTDIYFVEVYDQDDVLQFTREAWPNIDDGSSDTVEDIVINYIPNGQFLEHNNLPETDSFDAGEVREETTIIASGGWTFERDSGASSKDTILFNQFDANPVVQGNPRFEIDLQSDGNGSSKKDLAVKFDSVNKFASTSQKFTFKVIGQSQTGGNFDVELVLIKNYGTGGSPAPTAETVLDTYSFSPSYTSFSTSFVFGDNSKKQLGSNNDDYVQLALRFPLATTFQGRATDALLIINEVIDPDFPDTSDRQMVAQSAAGGAPVADYDGYDLYLPLVRTLSGLTYDDSEVGKKHELFYNPSTVPAGYLDANGDRYEVSGYSDDGVPYARLYSKIGNLFGTGPDYFQAQDQGDGTFTLSNNDAGDVTDTADGVTATTFTFTKIDDGVTTYMQAFPLTGQTADGVLEIRGLFSGTAGLNSVGNGTVSTGFSFSNQTDPSSHKTKYVARITVVTGLVGGEVFKFQAYDSLDGAAQDFYVWYTVDTVGSLPTQTGTGIQVEISGTDDENIIAWKTSQAIYGHEQTLIETVDGATVPQSSYFTASAVGENFYVWYNIDSAGTDPVPSGTGIEVAIGSTDTAQDVLDATKLAINSKYFAVPDAYGVFFRAWDDGTGEDPGRDNRFSLDWFASDEANNVGSLQLDANQDHKHDIPSKDNTSLAGSSRHLDNSDPNNTNQTSLAGNRESRPINMAVRVLIKY